MLLVVLPNVPALTQTNEYWDLALKTVVISVILAVHIYMLYTLENIALVAWMNVRI